MIFPLNPNDGDKHASKAGLNYTYVSLSHAWVKVEAASIPDYLIDLVDEDRITKEETYNELTDFNTFRLATSVMDMGYDTSSNHVYIMHD